MNCRFVSTLPADRKASPILISGRGSEKLRNVAYLLVDEEDSIETYELRYEIDGPFKDAMCVDCMIAVGYGDLFYLFDRVEKRNIMKLKMDGYFGHLYFDIDCFYITDTSGLHRINKLGERLWHNAALAVDGVIITDLGVDKIFGQAEIDPPGGWIDFVLDKENGALLVK